MCRLYTVTHSPSEEALTRLILQKFDELVSLVESCDDALANTELEAPGSNSVIQLLVHSCGLIRRWSSTVNLGQEIPRDRDREFHAKMSVPDAIALAQETHAAFLRDLESTDMQAAPSRVPPDRAHFWTVTCEGVLHHVLEEVSQHLGHAQITRDILVHRRTDIGAGGA